MWADFHALRLTTLVVLGGPQALAQVTAQPDSLRVVLVQGQDANPSVSLTNASTAAVAFCLDFDRPLQRTDGPAFGAGCGSPGELLAIFDSGDLGNGWLPYGITMTPDGRLFVAEWAGGQRTYELTDDFMFVRRFFHPFVSELAPFPRTSGVTYHAASGMLWWTNAEESAGALYRVLLLEGTLDGVATGRRIRLPIPPTGPPPTNSGYPNGASYDPAAGRFYYVDAQNNTLWAIDTTGTVPDGYPMTLDAYPGAHYVGNVVDAFGGAEGGVQGVRLELPVGVVLDNIFDRVTVTDATGRDLGYDETPLAEVIALNNGTASVLGAARSRLDPNGVLYVTYWTPGPAGVAAVRPVPLGPSWLALSAWSGTVPAGGSADITLTFSAGQRAPGEYRSTLVVEDTLGAVLASAALTLVVEADTPAEPGTAGGSASMSVAPNPSSGELTIIVTLELPGPARVALHDLLGREVALVRDGPLGAGRHVLLVDARALPPGVYIAALRAADFAVHRRLTVTR